MQNKILTGVLVACVCAMLMAVAACSNEETGQESHASVESALQAAVDRLAAENNFPGIQAAIIMPDGTVIEAAAGLADREQEISMTTNMRLLSGSIGKTYVAAAVMALVAEGKLALEEKVSTYVGDEDWYQGFPNGDDVTLGQMLNHSSGVPRDYLVHPEFLAAVKRSVDEDINLVDMGLTHEDFVRWVSGLEPGFAPGEGFMYTDVAYTVAALVAEKVDGRSLEDQIRERFITPYKLTRTEAQTRRMTDFVSAYFPPPMHPGFPGVPEKSVTMGVFAFDPGMEWGGGGYASNAGDLARWAHLWFGGEAVDGSYIETITGWGNEHVIPQLGDAYGVGVQIRYDSPFGERLYHGGYQLGFIARAEHLPEHGMSSAIMINTVDIAYERYHDEIWNAVLTAIEIQTDE
jgi:D-alanyl-D-alanine carboxypeptidase